MPHQISRLFRIQSWGQIPNNFIKIFSSLKPEVSDTMVGSVYPGIEFCSFQSHREKGISLKSQPYLENSYSATEMSTFVYYFLWGWLFGIQKAFYISSAQQKKNVIPFSSFSLAPPFVASCNILIIIWPVFCKFFIIC